MSAHLYVFEDGSYSDRSVARPVSGPEGADLDALYKEFVADLRSAIPKGEPYYFAAEDAYALLKGVRPLREVFGATPEGYFYCSDSEVLVAWLVERKGWTLPPVTTKAIERPDLDPTS